MTHTLSQHQINSQCLNEYSQRLQSPFSLLRQGLLRSPRNEHMGKDSLPCGRGPKIGPPLSSTLLHFAPKSQIKGSHKAREVAKQELASSCDPTDFNCLNILPSTLSTFITKGLFFKVGHTNRIISTPPKSQTKSHVRTQGQGGRSPSGCSSAAGDHLALVLQQPAQGKVGRAKATTTSSSGSLKSKKLTGCDKRGIINTMLHFAPKSSGKGQGVPGRWSTQPLKNEVLKSLNSNTSTLLKEKAKPLAFSDLKKAGRLGFQPSLPSPDSRSVARSGQVFVESGCTNTSFSQTKTLKRAEHSVTPTLEERSRSLPFYSYSLNWKQVGVAPTTNTVVPPIRLDKPNPPMSSQEETKGLRGNYGRLSAVGAQKPNTSNFAETAKLRFPEDLGAKLLHRIPLEKTDRKLKKTLFAKENQLGQSNQKALRFPCQPPRNEEPRNQGGARGPNLCFVTKGSTNEMSGVSIPTFNFKGGVQAPLKVNSPLWGILLFSREEFAFLNLRSILSTLLKALHVCLFAALNNKRILFVGDPSPLAQEHQQRLLSSFIGCQIKAFSTKVTERLPPLPPVLKPGILKASPLFSEILPKATNPKIQSPSTISSFGTRSPLLMAQLASSESAFDRAVLPHDKVVRGVIPNSNPFLSHLYELIPHSSPCPSPSVGPTRTKAIEPDFVPQPQSKWGNSRERGVLSQLGSQDQQADSTLANLDLRHTLGLEPGLQLEIGRFQRASSTPALPDPLPYYGKGITASEAKATFVVDPKLCGSSKAATEEQGLPPLFPFAPLCSSLLQSHKARSVAKQGQSQSKVSQSKAEASKLGSQGLIGEKLGKSHLAQKPGSEPERSQKLEGSERSSEAIPPQSNNNKELMDLTSPFFYIPLAKLVSKAGIRNSQWTATLAQSTHGLIGGFFSNSLARYEQSLASTTRLNLLMEGSESWMTLDYPEIGKTNLGNLNNPAAAEESTGVRSKQTQGKLEKGNLAPLTSSGDGCFALTELAVIESKKAPSGSPDFAVIGSKKAPSGSPDFAVIGSKKAPSGSPDLAIIETPSCSSARSLEREGVVVQQQPSVPSNTLLHPYQLLGTGSKFEGKTLQKQQGGDLNTKLTDLRKPGEGSKNQTTTPLSSLAMVRASAPNVGKVPARSKTSPLIGSKDDLFFEKPFSEYIKPSHLLNAMDKRTEGLSNAIYSPVPKKKAGALGKSLGANLIKDKRKKKTSNSQGFRGQIPNFCDKRLTSLSKRLFQRATQNHYKGMLHHCIDSQKSTDMHNPWLKEADLVFFTNPEKSKALLNQINRLGIPTLGIVNSGSNLAFPFRSVKGPSLLSSSPTLTYPIIGNSDSLNFLRIILAKFLRILNRERKGSRAP